LSSFAMHFKANGKDPDLVPYSPMLIEAESDEYAYLLGMQQLTDFVRDGYVSSFVVVGLLRLNSAAMSEEPQNAAQ
jgi:hypothetical protein